MKKLLFYPCLPLVVAFLFSCTNKGGTLTPSTPGEPVGFHIDEMLTDQVQAQNRTLLFIASPYDQSKLLCVSARGPYENNNNKGFRVISIDTATGVEWIKTYVHNTDFIQNASAADIDQQQNIWIGGYVFGKVNTFGGPYITKLDKDGNVIFAKTIYFWDEFSLQETERCIAIKTLANGDVFVILEGVVMRLNSNGDVVWKKAMRYTPSTYAGDGSDKQIIEVANGDLLFSLAGCLFRIQANGTLVYAKNYQFGQDYSTDQSPNLLLLPNGDLLLTATRYLSAKWYPYFLRINAATGNVLLAKTGDYAPGNGYVAVNDIHLLDNKLVVGFTINHHYVTVQLDDSLQVKKVITTLETSQQNFDVSKMFLVNRGGKSLYHIIDAPGPSGGQGFQFMKSDNDGQSCQLYLPSYSDAFSLQTLSPVVSDLAINEVPFTQVLDTVVFEVNTGFTFIHAKQCGK